MAKQLHAIHFFVVTRNVCHLAIPESCAQNTSLQLLENHSFQIGLLCDLKYEYSISSRSYFNYKVVREIFTLFEQ